MDGQLLEIVTGLVTAHDRPAAARRLATALGCSDLLVFIVDEDVGKVLPAPGFAQTMPHGRKWKRFLEECTPGSVCRSHQKFPGSDVETGVVGVAIADGTVLVVGGGGPEEDQLEWVLLLLPLLSAAFRGELVARAAHAQSTVAELAARSAETLATTLDETRQDLQRALIETEKALHIREEFLSIASHELKTPLTGLMLQVQMIQRAAKRLGEPTPGERQILSLLAPMERSLRRLVTLTNDLLDVSRISAGRLALRRETVHLEIIAREVVERFSQDTRDREVEMMLDIAEPIVGHWDPSRLDQVLTNLVANALAYGRGTPIEILMTNGPTSARIEVRDHGPGIAAEDQERIFRRFERAVLKDDDTGLGLGLHITREIVHAHGGRIHVETTVGLGATFVVELPYNE